MGCRQHEDWKIGILWLEDWMGEAAWPGWHWELCHLVENSLDRRKAQREEQLGGHDKDQARDEMA